MQKKFKVGDTVTLHDACFANPFDGRYGLLTSNNVQMIYGYNQEGFTKSKDVKSYFRTIVKNELIITQILDNLEYPYVCRFLDDGALAQEFSWKEEALTLIHSKKDVLKDLIELTNEFIEKNKKL